MIQRKYETVVGVFVVATLIVLMGMVLLIAQQKRLWEDREPYKAVFKNTTGLKVGSEVRLSGVTVGDVKKISFDATGNIIVEIEVAQKYKDRIREDSKATIGSIGLLGDMSFNITSGSSSLPPIPPGGIIPSIEPLELSTFLEKAAPAMTDVQKGLANFRKITDSLVEQKDQMAQLIVNMQEMFLKINRGQGSLGKLINEPKLYDNLNQTISETQKFVSSLNSQKGLLGTILHDPKFNAQGHRSMNDLKASLENLRQATERIQEASVQFPSIAQKSESFLDYLNKAGSRLPALMNSGEGLISDADTVAKAAQKSWLLRRHIPQEKERTIVIDREIKGDRQP
jgi:phospholipid/cholesterol/gamma-HCH transport system substrate-binding protein